jgi:hypothetical protein
MEASHFLPQETSSTWHQIYKATQVNARLAALALRLLGQGSLGSPHPQPFPLTALARYLSPPRLGFPPDLYRSYPLLSIDFPCGPFSLPPSLSSYIAGCFRLVAQSAAYEVIFKI